MVLQNLDNWKDVLGLEAVTTQLPTPETTKFDTNKAFQEAQAGHDWYQNVLRLVGSWVAKGLSDEEIYKHSEALTCSGYSVEETRLDFQPMIEGARNKGFDRNKGSLLDQSKSSNGIVSESYYYQNGSGLYFYDYRKVKNRDTKLCNFTAEITHEVTKVDGQNSFKTLLVQGQQSDGTYFPSVDIEATQFDGMDWVMSHWGAKAIMNVVPKSKDHVAAATYEMKTVYLHTGWIVHAKKYAYLSASGGITATGYSPDFATELSGSLNNYELPAPCADIEVQVSRFLELFSDLIDDGTGLLILSGAFRAIFSEFVPCTVSLYLQGTTGTYKSAVVGVVQALFGKTFNGSNLPENWSSTGNAIEKKAALAKDAMLVVDDFVARGTQSDVARMHRDAERVLRSQGNQSGRDRMTSTTELRGANVPKGMICATGEDLPNGHSLQARLVIINMKKGSTNTGVLSQLQDYAQTGDLAQLNANFIRWIAAAADEGTIEQYFNDALSSCAKQLPAEGHARTRDNLSQMLAGLWIYLQYAVDVGVMHLEAADIFKLQAIKTVLALSQIQAGVDKDASDAERFVKILQSALSMGSCHLAAQGGGSPKYHTAAGWKLTGSGAYQKIEGQGVKVGWMNDKHVFMDITAAQKVVKQLSQATGNYLGSSDRAVTKALYEANMLAEVSKDRLTMKVTVEGQRRNLLCMDTDLFMDIDYDVVAPDQLFLDYDVVEPDHPILDCLDEDIPF
jgi:hypothetical protein